MAFLPLLWLLHLHRLCSLLIFCFSLTHSGPVLAIFFLHTFSLCHCIQSWYDVDDSQICISGPSFLLSSRIYIQLSCFIYVHSEHVLNWTLYLNPILLHSSCFSSHILFPISMDYLLSTWLSKQQLRHCISITVHIKFNYWILLSSPNTVTIYPLSSIPSITNIVHIYAGVDFYDSLPARLFSDSEFITLGSTDPKVFVGWIWIIHEFWWREILYLYFHWSVPKLSISFLRM